MRTTFTAFAVALTLLTSCSSHENRTTKCAAFESGSKRLTAARDAAGVTVENDSNPITAASADLGTAKDAYQLAQRTLAEFYVQDASGCATAEDKAHAQADLDTLNAAH
jgi:hypothetical protein